MISVLLSRGLSFTKCSLHYFLLFFLVITSIPSTLALQEEIIVTQFESSPFFLTIYSLVISILIPIIIRETFHKKLYPLSSLFWIYIVLWAIDLVLTYKFTLWCSEFYNDSFFWSYFYCLVPLFILYFIEILVPRHYISKYLNIISTFYNFLISLIFLKKASGTVYVIEQFDKIIIILLAILYAIILFLNTISNLFAISKSPGFIGKLVDLKQRYDEFQKKFNFDDNDNDEYNANCPICYSHHYIHANLNNGFEILQKDEDYKNKIQDCDNKIQDCKKKIAKYNKRKNYNKVNKCEEEKRMYEKRKLYKEEIENYKKTNEGHKKGENLTCLVCEKDHNEEPVYCPVCMGHHLVHVAAHAINKVEGANNAGGVNNGGTNNAGGVNNAEEIEEAEKAEARRRIYLKINEVVNYFYYLLNFLCAIAFAMISGPSIWWIQLYLTVNSTEYSIYQNSGPDSTYSVFKNIVYDFVTSLYNHDDDNDDGQNSLDKVVVE